MKRIVTACCLTVGLLSGGLLLRAADDGDGEVRSQAVSLLGEIEAWKTLEQIAKENKNEEVRRLAAEQLENK